MNRPPAPQGTSPQHYSPDGQWYWDGSRWLPASTAANAEVTIWASQMRPGGLPSVCVKTGRQTNHWMRAGFRTMPPWAPFLLCIGFLPYLIVRVTLAVTASGHLPVDTSVAGRLRALWISGLAGTLLGVVLLVVGGSLGSSAGAILAVLGVALVAAGIALVVVFRIQWVGAVVQKPDGYPNDRLVTLRRVHPNFVQAVRAQQQQAATPQPGYSPPAGYGPQPAYSAPPAYGSQPPTYQQTPNRWP